MLGGPVELLLLSEIGQTPSHDGIRRRRRIHLSRGLWAGRPSPPLTSLFLFPPRSACGKDRLPLSGSRRFSLRLLGKAGCLADEERSGGGPRARGGPAGK